MRRRSKPVIGTCVAALCLAVAMATVAALACGDEGPGASPTTVATARATAAASLTAATATPTGYVCPAGDEEICAFALRMSWLLAANDMPGVIALTQAQSFVCPGPVAEGLGGPYPLCDGASPGETREGYVVAALQSEGSVVSREGYEYILRFPNSSGRLATVGCALAAGVPECSRAFAVTFEMPADSLLRFAVARPPDGEPRIVEVVTGIVTLSREMIDGGDDDLPIIFGSQGGSGRTRYFPVP